MIRNIFIAAAPGEPMVSLPEVVADEERGLVGDRYGDLARKLKSENHITLIEFENIEAFEQEWNLPLAPHEPRRNLVTQGVRLNALCGKRFCIGEVEVEGLELCEPCRLFAKRTYPEVLKFFVNRGGLRGRILRGGTIHVGDAVKS